MEIETDPAETPEDTTAADPQAEEESAESTEQSEEGSETSEDQGKPENKPDEVEIVIEGEPAKVDEPPKDAVAWSKARFRQRELEAENARLKAEAQARAQPTAAPDPGDEPTLETSEWDENKLKAKHAVWLKAKETQDAEKAQASQKAEKQKLKWEENKSAITRSRAALIQRMPSSPETPGYLEAESAVDAAFAGDRMGKMAAIMHVCGEKTPMVVAYLGRNPERLKDLREEEDLPRFIAKVSKLEDKVQEKKKAVTPPPPEKKIGGTGGSSGAVDSREEQLRAKAMESGDSTELRAYQKSKRKK